jgi:4-hydroxy-tetrahydrodipicolinate synthase
MHQIPKTNPTIETHNQSCKTTGEARTSRRGFLQASTSVAGLAAAGGFLGGPASASAQAADAGGRKTPARRRSARSKLDFSGGCPADIRAKLSGPWPSIHTPFTKSGEIDYAALRGQLDFALEAKAKAVVLTWGDSLFSILTDDEIAAVTKVVVEHIDGRAFVVAATDRWWTGRAAEFAAYCDELGADMVMALPPDWAASTTVDTLVDYYAALTEHLPVMLVTNYLSRRGAPFALELCGRLLKEVPGVIAVKDDLCNDTICKICLMAHDRWTISAGGQKKNHMLMMPYGVDGYLSTFMTFNPKIAWRYWNAIEDNDMDAAMEVVRKFDMPFFDYIIGCEGSFDAAIHGIDEIIGCGRRWRRMPYYSLTDRQMAELKEFLRKHKMI